MEIYEIRSQEQLDESLRRDMPEIIKESWRKMVRNMGVYTEAYEQDEQIWGIGVVEAELAKGSRWFVVRERDEWIAAVVVDDIWHRDEPALQIRTLVVHPKAQGQGIAQKLLDHIAAVGANEDKRYVTLYTTSLSPALVRFYERIGFTEYKREQVERYGKQYARVFLSRPVDSNSLKNEIEIL